MKKTIHILIFAIVISAVSGFGTVGLSNDIFIKYGEKVLIKFKQLEQAEELLVLAPLPENAVAENVNIIKSNFFEDSEFILPDGTKPVGDCDLVEYNGERYIKIKSYTEGVDDLAGILAKQKQRLQNPGLIVVRTSGFLSTEMLLASGRITIGVADLAAFTTSNFCNNSNTEFCKDWKEYELYVNMGLLTTSLADVIITKLRKSYTPSVKAGMTDDQISFIENKLGIPVNTRGKSELLLKLNNYTRLKTWVNSLDEVNDAYLIYKLDGLEDTYLQKLNIDLANNKYGNEIKTLLNESPIDLTNIWKQLKDDPAYSWEIKKTGGSRWEKWGQREFFKDITAKGKGFERDVCLTAFKNRNSAKYIELKNKFNTDFGKNLDEYDMYSQVQLKYNDNNYFVADQVYVKYDTFGDVDDIIVIENKLSSSTPFTTPQNNALQSNSYTVRSIEEYSEMGTGNKLTSGDIINFKGNKQWYKVHSSGDGAAITGIQKIQ